MFSNSKKITLILLTVFLCFLDSRAQATEDIFDPKVVVFSVDGGGMRGVIPLKFLEKLQESVGFPLASLKDSLWGGPSVGSIITGGLNVPEKLGSSTPKCTPTQMLELFFKDGKTIFPASGYLGRWDSGWGLYSNQYDSCTFCIY